jgi:hypothetical protein
MYVGNQHIRCACVFFELFLNQVGLVNPAAGSDWPVRPTPSLLHSSFPRILGVMPRGATRAIARPMTAAECGTYTMIHSDSLLCREATDTTCCGIHADWFVDMRDNALGITTAVWNSVCRGVHHMLQITPALGTASIFRNWQGFRWFCV